MRKRLYIRVFLFVMLGLGAGVMSSLGFLQYWAQKSLVTTTRTVSLRLEPKMSLRSLAHELEGLGLVSNRYYFHIWVKIFADYTEFQAGNYRFVSPVSPRNIVQAMQEGKTYIPLVLSLNIPEGFTLKQIAARMEASKIGSQLAVLSVARNPNFLSSVGLGAYSDLEGFLYPATYHFYESLPSIEEALARMVREFWYRIPPDFGLKSKERGITLRQGITLASLIERETSQLEEKAYIAEVIWNRLRDQMPLAIDASVIYGASDYKGNLTRKHLRDRRNPYNSRIFKGIPPGPIGSPGRTSMEAVFNPSAKGYYFYVLLPESGGRHHFSKTLAEHNIYVKKLVSYLRKRESLRNPEVLESPETIGTPEVLEMPGFSREAEGEATSEISRQP